MIDWLFGSVLGIITTLFLIWVGVTGWFFALSRAIMLRDAEQDDLLDWRIKVPIYVYLAIGVVFDVLFNWTFGTLIFRELPREFLFTSRVQRHADDDNPRADYWVRVLNIIEPGHVKDD